MYSRSQREHGAYYTETWDIPEKAKSKFLKVKNKIRIKKIASGINVKLDIIDTQKENKKKLQQKMFRPKHGKQYKWYSLGINFVPWGSCLEAWSKDNWGTENI